MCVSYGAEAATVFAAVVVGFSLSLDLLHYIPIASDDDTLISPPSSASPRRPTPTVEEGQKQPFIESFIIDVDSRAAAACVPDLTHWPMADSQMHLIACPCSCTYMYNLGIRFLIGMILTSRKKEERGERDSNAHSAFVFNLTE